MTKYILGSVCGWFMYSHMQIALIETDCLIDLFIYGSVDRLIDRVEVLQQSTMNSFDMRASYISFRNLCKPLAALPFWLTLPPVHPIAHPNPPHHYADEVLTPPPPSAQRSSRPSKHVPTFDEKRTPSVRVTRDLPLGCLNTDASSYKRMRLFLGVTRGC